MLSNGLVSASYIAASVLFILALGGLSNQESAKRAVWYGIVGMGDGGAGHGSGARRPEPCTDHRGHRGGRLCGHLCRGQSAR